jgi:N utilization substance protein A
VIVDDEERSATIIVPDDQLSLAIGKEGQNARLASKLTGWRIDIKSQTEMAQVDAEAPYAGADDEFSGQCVAVTGTGKRCVNQALAGGRYCGIHADGQAAEGAVTDEASEEE